mgnify:FL=1
MSYFELNCFPFLSAQTTSQIAVLVFLISNNKSWSRYTLTVSHFNHESFPSGKISKMGVVAAAKLILHASAWIFLSRYVWNSNIYTVHIGYGFCKHLWTLYIYCATLSCFYSERIVKRRLKKKTLDYINIWNGNNCCQRTRNRTGMKVYACWMIHFCSIHQLRVYLRQFAFFKSGFIWY